MSTRRIGEIVAAVGVITSLVFVGQELRQSNIQARAAAYQELGLATADFHLGTSEALVRLVMEARHPEAIARWTALDWELFTTRQLGGMRQYETLLLQVEQGLLPADAIDRLGYGSLPTFLLAVPGIACVWPRVSPTVSEGVRELVESIPEAKRHHCEIDLEALEIDWVAAGGD
jgi:hypothetical protein